MQFISENKQWIYTLEVEFVMLSTKIIQSNPQVFKNLFDYRQILCTKTRLIKQI